MDGGKENAAGNPIQQDWETRQLVQTLTNALRVMQSTVTQFGEPVSALRGEPRCRKFHFAFTYHAPPGFAPAETTVKSRLTDISDRVDK